MKSINQHGQHGDAEYKIAMRFHLLDQNSSLQSTYGILLSCIGQATTLMRMGKMYWTRLVMMVITLVAVLWLMHNLSSDSKRSENVTLCPSRVKLAEIATDGVRLQQEGTKWIRNSTGINQELDSIAVEKWFSMLCSISSQATASGSGFQPVLSLSYVTGETQLVLRAPTGEFQLRDIKFNSKDLEDALSAFRTLPEAKPPGTH